MTVLSTNNYIRYIENYIGVCLYPFCHIYCDEHDLFASDEAS